MIQRPTKKNCGSPFPPQYASFGRKRGIFSKAGLGFRNFGCDFWVVVWDVWRWICRHCREKILLLLMGGRAEYILVHNLVLLGFNKRIKVLAVPEVRPNLTQSLVEKYKWFEKFRKGFFFRHVFSFFYFQTKLYQTRFIYYYVTANFVILM
jgi:hypothetical protein